MNRNQILIFTFGIICVTFISSVVYFGNYDINQNQIHSGFEKMKREQDLLKDTIDTLTTHIKEIKQQTKSLKYSGVSNQSPTEYFINTMKEKLSHTYTQDQKDQVGLHLLNTVLFQDGECKEYKILGGGQTEGIPGEGSWQICQDLDKWHVNRSSECKVFSFGIANDFTFDDELTKLGCRVESFDPSMAMASTKRSELNNFWKIGIAAQDQADFAGKEYGGANAQVWEVYTLQTLMKKFNVDYLDFLKMDIEGNEWPVLKQWVSEEEDVLSKVKLLTFEIHFWGDGKMETHLEWARIILGLRLKGFRLFGVRENPMSTHVNLGFLTPNSCCFDLYWYNENI